MKTDLKRRGLDSLNAIILPGYAQASGASPFTSVNIALHLAGACPSFMCPASFLSARLGTPSLPHDLARFKAAAPTRNGSVVGSPGTFSRKAVTAWISGTLPAALTFIIHPIEVIFNTCIIVNSSIQRLSLILLTGRSTKAQA